MYGILTGVGDCLYEFCDTGAKPMNSYDVNNISCIIILTHI